MAETKKKKSKPKKKMGRRSKWTDKQKESFVTRGEKLAHGKLGPFLKENGIPPANYFMWRKQFPKIVEAARKVQQAAEKAAAAE